MKIGVPPLGRAFQLAREGLVADVEDIKKTLRREGYNTAELQGPELQRQLRETIRVAREKPNRR